MRVKLLVTFALLFLGSRSAGAAVQCVLTSFSVTQTQLVGGSNQIGVETVTAAMDGASTCTFTVGTNPQSSDLSAPGGTTTTSSSYTFTYYAVNPVSQSTNVGLYACTQDTPTNVCQSLTITIVPPTLSLTISPTGFVGLGNGKPQAIGTVQLANPPATNTSAAITVSGPSGVA